jgi:hypothetical protein
MLICINPRFCGATPSVCKYRAKDVSSVSNLEKRSRLHSKAVFPLAPDNDKSAYLGMCEFAVLYLRESRIVVRKSVDGIRPCCFREENSKHLPSHQLLQY